MPLVQITIIEGRSDAQIKDMAQRVTADVAATMDVPAQAVRVIVNQVPASKWFVAGVAKSEAG